MDTKCPMCCYVSRFEFWRDLTNGMGTGKCDSTSARKFPKSLVEWQVPKSSWGESGAVAAIFVKTAHVPRWNRNI